MARSKDSANADAASSKKTVTPARSTEARPVIEKRGGDDAPNPVWFKPIMFGLMLIGLAWIIVFYVSGSTLPVESLGDGNILVGFGILFIGFLMTTRWR
ncbi:MAG: hypothetical protein RI885_2504 [Actinomycetota bacterium]|jgi:hypothetical protein